VESLPSKGNNPRIAVLGAGRLGTVLTRSLREAAYPAVLIPQSAPGWSRARRLGLPTLRWIPQEGEIFFFCVPDSRIRSICDLLASEGRVFPGRLYVHCAGALTLDVLGSARRSGAHVGSLHPLVSVASAKGTLAGAFAAVEGDASARRTLSQIAHDLAMHPFVLSHGQRARYHAAAALASNGVIALARAAQRLLVHTGLSQGQAVHALVPLMASAVRALGEEGLPNALTGPISRSDVPIIQSHLSAIRSDPEVAAVYRSLSLIAVELASRRKGADRAAMRKLRTLLSRRG
jgi:predicted short-subunit dehydrogenase-like oxidoreductase (DUF2520 family)